LIIGPSGSAWLPGAAAILCCVSPVVLFLFGLATAAEAIALGNRLYYGYTWYFRAGGLVIAVIAAALYLRRRRSCSLRGAVSCWRSLLGSAASMVLTYTVVYAATSYLAFLGSRSR
jgi:hypothetical protein